MTYPSRTASASLAVILCALVAFSGARPAVAVAGPTPAPIATTSSTTLPVSGGGAAVTTTTSTTAFVPPLTTTTLAPAPPPAPTPTPSIATTTTVGPTTTVAPTTVPPTTTTLSAAQLSALLNGLDKEVAQAQAVSDYLAARALAASLAAGQAPPTSADPVLVEAAAAQLRADAAQAAAQQRFDAARHRIGQVAVALYLGEQVPRAGSAIMGSVGDRSAFLAGILESGQHQAKLAKEELARATAASNASRKQADQVVQARTSELQ
ncbi:MAG: hypothetical protein M3083_08285, partial [Actinomycetota bacterium]|nr:hypothetical protein [Actinomycetota bacterium]